MVKQFAAGVESWLINVPEPWQNTLEQTLVSYSPAADLGISTMLSALAADLGLTMILLVVPGSPIPMNFLMAFNLNLLLPFLVTL